MVVKSLMLRHKCITSHFKIAIDSSANKVVSAHTPMSANGCFFDSVGTLTIAVMRCVPGTHLAWSARAS